MEVNRERELTICCSTQAVKSERGRSLPTASPSNYFGEAELLANSTSPKEVNADRLTEGQPVLKELKKFKAE